MKTTISITASFLLGAITLGAAACDSGSPIIPAQCNTAADCPGSDTQCRARICRENACGYEFIAKDTKVPASHQSPGDCKELVCDGEGGTVIKALAEGDVCTEAGGKVCSANGICVHCITNDDCPGQTCVDGTCIPASCLDNAKNGSETDVDCGGPACPRCEDGKSCLLSNDCKSTSCLSETCQPAKCGDGARQGDEECDDGNQTSGDGCTPDCKADILFFDDMETGAPGWTHTLLKSAGSVTDQWHITDARAASGLHAYHSGISPAGEGDTRLISPIIDLSTLKPGTKVKLTFSELHHFDDCGSFDFNSDGAIIEILSGKPPLDLIEQLTPIGGYPDTLDDICGNPLAGLPAFTHDTAGLFHVIEVDLTPYTGQPIRLGFHVGWDCGNCTLEEGFYVDDVRVERLP